MMKPIACIAVILCLSIKSSPFLAAAELTAARQDDRVTVSGGHFRLTIDGKQGGQISDIRLFDGSLWNRLLGEDARTCPALKLRGLSEEFSLARASDARIERFEVAPGLVRVETVATPRSAEGRASPWTVKLQYEIYAEGAIFVTLECALPEGREAVVTGAEIALELDRAVVEAAKYRQQTAVGGRKPTGLPSARVAFGVNPERSYTNEVQAIVEDKASMGGETCFDAKKGQFTWTLASAKTTLQGPFCYRNRLAIGLGAAATGKPRTNLIAQRVYHWINWIDRKDIEGAAWYPSDEVIDRMAANHATLLVLHMHWMQERGSNGFPHADYRHPRDEQALIRTIRHAHEKGMRVGLYCRGIERYAPSSGFFEKYLKRDWDGLYVDWDGEYCIGFHENQRKPEADLGDTHFSTDGSYLPARDYFLYIKKLRKIVGPKGFLIGHMGFGNTGILANLVKDGYLPGESGFDHDMFTKDVDDAIYQGMLGGVACMPWTIDAAEKYTGPPGMARMAVWGFYPHACMAYKRPNKQYVLPADPDAPANAYVLPYWRVLAAVDAERSTVYNSPAVNRVAATSSHPRIPCLIYKQAGDTADDEAFLVVVANLSDEPDSATITLKPEVLGMNGRYRISRIDSRTGDVHEAGTTTGTLTTSRLAPWGIEGLKLNKTSMTKSK